MASRAHPRLHHFSTHQLQLSHKNFFGPALSISHTHITSTHTRATQSWITRASLNFFFLMSDPTRISLELRSTSHSSNRSRHKTFFFFLDHVPHIDRCIDHTHAPHCIRKIFWSSSNRHSITQVCDRIESIRSWSHGHITTQCSKKFVRKILASDF